mmetsp:Transcript_9932/g.17890  ORF Transcript_9932/g.17890 Transcript_9932/m.17890 type:complete len:91 (+) Transcript_9932:593-865(+)
MLFLPPTAARAMRSLADAAHRKKEYVESAKYWEAALALNPIHASGWFSLGHCYLKIDELDKAVHVKPTTLAAFPAAPFTRLPAFVCSTAC